jgi:DNA (cytosine-5)-methyltransferase 1
MTFLSLFSGIGGIDLGLERAGMKCIGQVEIDPFCRRVLVKHWPEVWKHGNVKTLTGELVKQHCGIPDLVVAGFPCQPVSQNGKKQAQDDARWLWPMAARIIRALRPAGVLLENVSGLLARGIDEVLGDLAACGYDAEWDSIPAAAFGAEHLRDRVFIFAYPAGARPQGEESAGRIWGRGLLAQRDRWTTTPRVLRGSHGFPHRVERIRALGNAVVPTVAEYIGRRIIEAAA